MQVLEFVKFIERLATSHARAMAYAELAMHGLTSLPSPSPAAMHEAASAAAHNITAALPSGAPLQGSEPSIAACSAFWPGLLREKTVSELSC
jgi:hypothetical protein